MSAKLTRISAPAGESKTRYIVNRVISALLARETVLLVSLDPQVDPYAAEMDELRAQAFYHDCDLIPDAPGHLGGHLAYVCWAGDDGKATPRLIGRLRAEPAALFEPDTWSADTLVIVDGCQWLGRKPLANWSAQLCDFIAGCVGNGHRVIAVGEHDQDTAWLDDLQAMRLPAAPAELSGAAA